MEQQQINNGEGYVFLFYKKYYTKQIITQKDRKWHFN